LYVFFGFFPDPVPPQSDMGLLRLSCVSFILFADEKKTGPPPAYLTTVLWIRKFCLDPALDSTFQWVPDSAPDPDSTFKTVPVLKLATLWRHMIVEQCCGLGTFLYGSGSDPSMSSGSGSSLISGS
jgi:hypothetical protein